MEADPVTEQPVKGKEVEDKEVEKEKEEGTDLTVAKVRLALDIILHFGFVVVGF